MFKKPIFELLVNFLLGVSWATALLGAFFAFETFYSFGLFTALISAIIGSLTGLIFVILLEVVSLNINNFKENQKQSKLLENILDELKKGSSKDIDEKLSNN